MQQLNVTLPDELASFVSAEVEQGHYSDASAVVLDALRTLKRGQTSDEAKLAALREAIKEGLESGPYDGDAFDDVRRELGLPPREKY